MKKETKSSAATVDEYLDALPEKVRNTLEKVRRSIKAAAPQAEEIISYQIPAYKHNGAVCYFAAFNNHCSFFPASYAVMKMYEDDLRPFHISKGTIHFPLDKPLSSALVKKLVKAKLRENEAKLAAKKVAKKKI